MGIIIKSEREIAIMRQAGRIVATVLDILVRQLRPGMKTKELDVIAAREMERLGAKPSFKGYRGFPANLCVSVNDEIVHGIPGERVLRQGDIVSLDLGAIFMGFQGDAAVTVGVGEISSPGKRAYGDHGRCAQGWHRRCPLRSKAWGYLGYHAKLC